MVHSFIRQEPRGFAQGFMKSFMPSYEQAAEETKQEFMRQKLLGETEQRRQKLLKEGQQRLESENEALKKLGLDLTGTYDPKLRERAVQALLKPSFDKDQQFATYLEEAGLPKYLTPQAASEIYLQGLKKTGPEPTPQKMPLEGTTKEPTKPLSDLENIKNIQSRLEEGDLSFGNINELPDDLYKKKIKERENLEKKLEKLTEKYKKSEEEIKFKKESQQEMQSIFDDLMSFVEEDKIGFFNPLKGMFGGQTRQASEAFDLRARMLESIFRDKLFPKGVLSKERFNYLIQNIPKSSDLLDATKGKLLAIAKELKLDSPYFNLKGGDFSKEDTSKDTTKSKNLMPLEDRVLELYPQFTDKAGNTDLEKLKKALEEEGYENLTL